MALTRQKEVLPVGKGWKTIPELKKIFGRSRANTVMRARAGRRLGLLESFSGREYRNGKLVCVVWYRQKP